MTNFCYDPKLDLKERDPNDLHEHIKVKFNEVIGEPVGYHSCDFVWDASGCVYECCSMIVYHLSSFCCGCWFAGFYGIAAAQTTLCHVWYFTPFLKCLELIMWPFRCCWSICVQCVVNPWCEACGYIFTAFEDNPNRNMQWTC